MKFRRTFAAENRKIVLIKTLKNMITKKGNLTEVVQIYDTCTNIVICEFIATNFAEKDYDNNYNYWNYLQSRKNYICRARNLNPYKFEIK